MLAAALPVRGNGGVCVLGLLNALGLRSKDQVGVGDIILKHWRFLKRMAPVRKDTSPFCRILGTVINRVGNLSNSLQNHNRC